MFSRKKEASKEKPIAKKQKVSYTSDLDIIRKKLKLTSQAPEEKIAFELSRLKGHQRLWKEIGISKDDFIRFGIKI